MGVCRACVRRSEPSGTALPAGRLLSGISFFVFPNGPVPRVPLVDDEDHVTQPDTTTPTPAGAAGLPATPTTTTSSSPSPAGVVKLPDAARVGRASLSNEQFNSQQAAVNSIPFAPLRVRCTPGAYVCR